MFRSARKHVHFALGVDPTARDTGEGEGSDLVSQATPFAVSCGLVAIHVPSLHKSISSSLARRQANAVEFALALPWLRGNSATDVVYEGELCNV